MKNPQNYKKYYKVLHEMRTEIYMKIRSKLSELESKSIGFNDPFLSTCHLAVIDEDKAIIAMGLVLNEDNMKVTVHGGVYEPENEYDMEEGLDMFRLLRLYKVFEEATTEYPIEPFEK